MYTPIYIYIYIYQGAVALWAKDNGIDEQTALARGLAAKRLGLVAFWRGSPQILSDVISRWSSCKMLAYVAS